MSAPTLGRRNDISETNQDRVHGCRCVKEWSRKPASSLDLILSAEREVTLSTGGRGRGPHEEEVWRSVLVSRRRSEKAGKATVTLTSTDTQWTRHMAPCSGSIFQCVQLEDEPLSSGSWRASRGQEEVLQSNLKKYCRVHSLSEDSWCILAY